MDVKEIILREMINTITKIVNKQYESLISEGKITKDYLSDLLAEIYSFSNNLNHTTEEN